jgi:CelD/BcsL family acetyltransferase involved in cellulose biosynthesis
MRYTVTEESLDSLNHYWTDSRQNLNWPSVFVLPAWLQAWWTVFGSGAELNLRAVRHDEGTIGIAPLLLKDGSVSFIGSTDVCDYLDFIVVPGMENDFFTILLDDLNNNGIKHLDLKHVRPDSTVLNSLVPVAQGRGCDVQCSAEDISLEVDLPSTWEEYLELLAAKQRHEVKRKLRRLWEAGSVEHRCLESVQEAGDYLDIFLELFPMSREDKADFMTPQMESFFRHIAKAMEGVGMLRFGIIEIDRQPAAMTMGFDYNDTHYLYNSAYDPRFNYLSVGVLCKVLCLKESIEKGKKKWDFLKGGETYKYHLGGREVPLYSCQIIIR